MDKTLLHSFEKDGIIYPPIEAECGNCFFLETKTVGFNFGREVLKGYCYFIDKFMEIDQEPCIEHTFDNSFEYTEQADEYWRLEQLGELDEQTDELAHNREIEDFLSF